jgi:C-terminal processing protease CtpA/Prc
VTIRQAQLFLLISLILYSSMISFAQTDTIPLAEIIVDEGGVQVISGEVFYTSDIVQSFNRGVTNLALVNQALYVDRDYISETPTTWQTIGEITSDIYISPFTYELHLPIVPRGPLRDISRTGQEGVAIFGVMTYSNFRGNPYWDTELEYAVGFNSFTSTREFELRYDIVGGKLLIWAPDDEQFFSSGYGDDRKLFTEDDPLMRVPAGWSVVDLDTQPFTLNRAQSATVDLHEQEQSLKPYDFSNLSYIDAFESLFDVLRREYAFTEYKGIDWDNLYQELRPAFVEATETNNSTTYQYALQELVNAIPDGHIYASLPMIGSALHTATSGGVGISVRELDDGRIIVTYVVSGSPAEQAGVEVGAELLGINDAHPLDRVDEIAFWVGTHSTDHVRRLHELRYITRFPVGESVLLTFRNPDSSEIQSAKMITISEQQSLAFSTDMFRVPQSNQPILFQMMPSGYAYVRITSFRQYPEWMFRTMEWVIDQLNAQSAKGLILDMRWNGGGYNLDRWFAGYFFEERVPIGNRAQYYTDIDDFFIDPYQVEEITPPDDGRYYGGPIVLLTGPACSSACEFFSYNMTLNDRSAVVGFYPSGGLGGSIKPVYMPDDVYFQFTITRALDTEGNIRLEGIGVIPDVKVPINEETLFADHDVEMRYAIEYLDNITSYTAIDGGAIYTGQSVSFDLNVGERVRFKFTTPDEGGEYDMIVSSYDATLDTVLYVYDASNLRVPIIENDNDPEGGLQSALRALEIPGGTELVIEVGTFYEIFSGRATLTINRYGIMSVDADARALGEQGIN